MESASSDASSHALVIGVSRYLCVRPLPPTHDAEDVAALLTDPARGGYPPANVTVLTDEAATRDGILRALDDLAARAAASRRVVVYFSGHGGSTKRECCYLMPVDGVWSDDAALAATAIASAELNARLRRITADQVTVILDCCRAAGLAEARDFDPDDGALAGTFLEQRLGSLAPGKGRAVLAASRAGGSAYVTPGQRNGLFTRHLLAGLRGAAHRAGDVVRVSDLYHHVREQVVAEMPAQSPVFKAELEENYALVRCPGVVAPPLPAPTGGFEYDAFLSYDPSQRTWLDKVLRPRLEALGLKLAVDHRTFRPGYAWLDEAARAAERSRYTVALITPEYLASGYQKYEAVLGRHLTADQDRPRFIPLLRGAAALPLGIAVTTALDATPDADLDDVLARLAVAVREPVT